MKIKDLINKGRDWAKENPEKMKNLKGLFSKKEEEEKEDIIPIQKSAIVMEPDETTEKKGINLPDGWPMYAVIAVVILFVLFRKKLKF